RTRARRSWASATAPATRAPRTPPSRRSPARSWKRRSTAPRASCSTSPPARTSPCRRCRRRPRSCARRPTPAPTSSSAWSATTPWPERSRSQSSPPVSAARPSRKPGRRRSVVRSSGPSSATKSSATSTSRPSCATGCSHRGANLRCPYCGHHDLKVVDSRDSEIGEAIRRRRECLQCGQRFTTYERIETVPFFVTKKDGRREDFDPQKLFNGLKKATEKRDISPERLRAIVDDIEAELRRSGRVEIPSGEIGEMVMERLRDLDEVAYIRFASVYREFMDLQQVKREIEQVLSSRRS